MAEEIKEPARNASPARQPDGSHGGGHSDAGGEKIATPKEGERRPEDSGREECEKKAAEYLTGWQRERADFLNYKKDELGRISEFLKYASEEVISKILPILDNFEIAEKNLSDKAGKDIKGFLQIKAQFQNFLKNHGVEEIKSIGEKFDANLHEAVEEVAEVGPPQADKSGVIVEEVQKGYIINGRLLRPAKVKINK